MDNNDKARIVIEAANKVADEFIAEGKPQLADQTLKAFEGVPVGSLAKFYDILQAVKTKLPQD